MGKYFYYSTFKFGSQVTEVDEIEYSTDGILSWGVWSEEMQDFLLVPLATVEKAWPGKYETLESKLIQKAYIQDEEQEELEQENKGNEGEND